MHKLPAQMPNELLVNGKSYKRVAGAKSVERGVCKSNDGAWHYYYNKTLVDGATVDIGRRRHFSVSNAKGRRSVHISMKPGAKKNDDIMIWYRYDDQWTGKKTEKAGWGRTMFNSVDQTRLQKAVDLLEKFLTAMTQLAEGKGATPVVPCKSPPVSSVPIQTSNDSWGEDVAFSPPVTTPSANPTVAVNVPDSWEDDF